MTDTLEIIQQPEIEVVLVAPHVVYLNGSDNPSKISTTEIAGVDISGHSVVIKSGTGTVSLADHNLLSHIHQVLGVSLNSATQGTEVQVQSFGLITEPSWNWIDGPVYLGVGGQLSQTPPTTGFLLIVGTAMAPTVLMVKLGVPITLA